MAKQTKLEASVKGVGNIHYIEAPRDRALQALGRMPSITAEQLAKARMSEGRNSASAEKII